MDKEAAQKLGEDWFELNIWNIDYHCDHIVQNFIKWLYREGFEIRKKRKK